ncbi:MAG: hypothetical protein J6C50_01535 [Rickettsiales bacterium]|nr:hypothetical protein [Rickettsiales bacterium]
MKFDWNNDKNEKLKKERGISFEELIYSGKLIGRIKNRSPLHPNQFELIIIYKDYCYSVPYVVQENGTLFLKTAHKDRKLDKTYNNYNNNK